MSTAQTSVAAASTCWNCKAATNGDHFCPACGKIQPLPRSADYFAFFGLPRKLRLDPSALEQRFHQLSWKLHPDNFVRAGEYERELSLDRASQLNDAFRALRDPVSRVEYLLASEGVRKEGQHKQQAPPELLEEVFELNESLDELRLTRKRGETTVRPAEESTEMAGLRVKLEAAQRNFEEKLAEVDAELEAVFGEWDAALDAAASPSASNGADDAGRKKLMARMNDLLNRRSYVRNLVANVQHELAEA